MRAAFIFAIALFFLSFTRPSDQSPPKNIETPVLQIKSFSENTLVVEWNLSRLDLKAMTAQDKKYEIITFPGCRYLTAAGKPQIPYYEFVLGVPDGAHVQEILTATNYENIGGILPIPVSVPGRDQQGMSENFFPLDSLDYNFLPGRAIEISEQQYFRSMPVIRVKLYPLQYDFAKKNLTVLRSAKLSFNFSPIGKTTPASVSRSKLDRLYEPYVLNFMQARNWLTEPVRSIRKSGLAVSGPWYRMEVNQEGMYKITRSTLSAAGIDVANLDPRTIKIYNHGGIPLPLKTSGTDPATLGPVENSIFVLGESDGIWNDEDYLLFYGKPLGGWDYSSVANDFIYIQHPYDLKNYYWLTFGGSDGKRMVVIPPAATAGTITDTYFMQRAHFEEDRYNLLASGTDWYGYRFFGLNGSAAFNYNLDYQVSGMQNARLRIKFKSANGIKWQDPLKYYYWFTVYLNSTRNPTPLLISSQLSSRTSVIFEKSFNASDYLVNGTNTVNVEYRGNLSDCSAHLDWVEFYHPHDYTVTDNALNFYTNTTGQLVNYGISGFTSTDARFFDISRPVDVKIIDNNNGIQSGVFNVTLDLRDSKPKHLLITSLNSTSVKTVSGLSLYEPAVNLLDNTLSADLIIITHSGFHSSAAELAALRNTGPDPLQSLVVDLRDIFFYFSSGVKDVVAIRDFIRYAYYNWTAPRPSYVLLFGDGHYDYRNIALADTNRVPPFEISSDYELDSRETDNFYVDVNYNSSDFSSIVPDLAIGRLPAESILDARRIVDKLKSYEAAKERDGWQTVLTFVADDEVTSSSSNEWMHQNQTESLATLSELRKFIKQKIYLSAYNSVPGGFGRVKPEANQAIIDQLNEGTLLINYVGHGSPEAWAHESALFMSRDLPRIQNEGRLAFWIAATCDFGKYDDPKEPSFSEALVWEENRGAIAVISSARLVFSGDNFNFNRNYLTKLFPNGGPSLRTGEALLLSTNGGSNDQKYHLFGDPSMYLADPRDRVQITAVTPDTLKALSKVKVEGLITDPNLQPIGDFNGGAFLIVNDAQYDSVNTGGPYSYILLGPRIFKGEISVVNGAFIGEFIVPKSIRYHNLSTGRITVYAWSENNNTDAMGFTGNLLFNGTEQNLNDDLGPQIDLYFKDQENFNNGDLVSKNPILVATMSDESGINLTREVGHTIEIKIDDVPAKDITSFFAYERDSYSNGKLTYYLENLTSGDHRLALQAWDNINNPGLNEIVFKVAASSEVILTDVYNYPNPFQGETNFTFQAQGLSTDAQIQIRVYTISGRLIKKLDNLTQPKPGFNYYPWNGRDEDGDELANGVYIYKIILKNAGKQKEILEKLVILK